MSDTLETKAEAEAEKAENLPAFDGVKLLGIKRKVAEILALIGRDGLFDQYTRHDIGHINVMLRSLDWIVPADTRKRMSPADWLMVVLAVYLHDLGMLVTKDEFEARGRSGFEKFCKDTLFAGDDGIDYQDKVNRSLPEALEREKFLYQEFVRAKHAERIRHWVTGKSPDRLGVATDAMREVAKLLDPLDPQFRRDLGLVCESHHLDDLADLDKYIPSQPYGNSEAETANVQYAAILLRTADLLHITRDRTPSVMFRLINPKDPISQQEWAKQRAVRSVRPQMGVNKEGHADPAAPQDTVEVNATFEKTDGFFGLTAYLTYADGQLRKTHDWARTCRKLRGVPHDFPWRQIDDERVTTEGFLRQSFEFTIDQKKILELLTGHTLYNDSSVAIRELVQNSLDAVRLQARMENRHTVEDTIGRIEVRWRSKERVLEVEDNGTGMTQQVIERHLLRVGSSKYQDPEFRRQFPDYSPISRFGIGILSAFMIAGDVEILTVSPDEEEARLIHLRSVHGKYLVQLRDKESLRGSLIAEHGTRITLALHPSAQLPSIQSVLERWVVVPRCAVSLVVDDGPPITIGHKSPQDALESYVRKLSGGTLDQPNEGRGLYRYRVESRQTGDTSVAFVVRWSDFFRVWEIHAAQDTATELLPIGTCVEGIRVETTSPGFAEDGLMCLVNARGPTAPKTNVARTAIDTSDPALRESLFTAIYQAYAHFIREELQVIHEQRGRSLTWAVQEARYLTQSLERESPVSIKQFKKTIDELPLILLEQHGQRRAWSVAEANSTAPFWTVHSPFTLSAEYLIRQAGGTASIAGLMRALALGNAPLPDGPVICESGLGRSIWTRLLAGKEVRRMKITQSDTRLDLEWHHPSSPVRWLTLASVMTEDISGSDEMEMLKRQIFNYFGTPLEAELIYIGASCADIEGRHTETIVSIDQLYFFLPGTPITEYLRQLMSEALPSTAPPGVVRKAIYSVLTVAAALKLYARWEGIMSLRQLRDQTENMIPTVILNYLEFELLLQTFHAVPPVIFDPTVRSSRDD